MTDQFAPTDVSGVSQEESRQSVWPGWFSESREIQAESQRSLESLVYRFFGLERLRPGKTGASRDNPFL